MAKLISESSWQLRASPDELFMNRVLSSVLIVECLATMNLKCRIPHCLRIWINRNQEEKPFRITLVPLTLCYLSDLSL